MMADKIHPNSVIESNEYTALAKYYDNLMTSGYYDYKSFAIALQEVLGERRNILDMGIGTGLLTEQILLLEKYNITGVDFSPEMLVQAKARLNNTSVKLVCADIEDYETNETFEAIISTGGTICISYREKEKQYRMYSYCQNKDAHLRLLKKLNVLLEKDGILCISIQGEHVDYESSIKDGITYAQTTDFAENSLRKTYVFSLDGKVLAQQAVQLIFFDERNSHELCELAGFLFVGIDRSNKVCIFQKKG